MSISDSSQSHRHQTRRTVQTTQTTQRSPVASLPRWGFRAEKVGLRWVPGEKVQSYLHRTSSSISHGPDLPKTDGPRPLRRATPKSSARDRSTVRGSPVWSEDLEAQRVGCPVASHRTICVENHRIWSKQLLIEWCALKPAVLQLSEKDQEKNTLNMESTIKRFNCPMLDVQS